MQGDTQAQNGWEEGEMDRVAKGNMHGAKGDVVNISFHPCICLFTLSVIALMNRRTSVLT